MTPLPTPSPKIREALLSLYEEVMWLAGRPNVTPGRARAWYTHVMAESVKRQVRHFTGQVSEQAVAAGGTGLRLEHYMRIQTTLTQLVDRHRKQNVADPEEFVRTLLEYEQVHIVTIEENYDAMRAKGDYLKVDIKLVSWGELSPLRQSELWAKMLRGKVSNYKYYAPHMPSEA